MIFSCENDRFAKIRILYIDELGVISSQNRKKEQKRARLQLLGAGHIPGDDLLSQDLSSHYHRRCGVSLPGSEWDRVVPPRSGHQRAILFDQDWDSGDLSFGFFCPLSDIHTETSNFLT